MWAAQTPGVPDPSTLKDLNPAVAITFLAVFALVAVLTFFGGAIKERLAGKPADPASPPTHALVSPPPPVATPAVDRSNDLANQFITSLQQQIEDLKEQIELLTRENGRLGSEVSDLRVEVQRLRWQGGGRSGH